MTEKTEISIQLSAEILLDLKAQPLRHGRFSRSLETRVLRLLAMEEADRVVKALHQVRANLAQALDIANQEPLDIKGLLGLLTASRLVMTRVLP